MRAISLSFTFSDFKDFSKTLVTCFLKSSHNQQRIKWYLCLIFQTVQSCASIFYILLFHIENMCYGDKINARQCHFWLPLYYYKNMYYVFYFICSRFCTSLYSEFVKKREKLFKWFRCFCTVYSHNLKRFLNG